MSLYLYRGISKEKYETDGRKIIPYKSGASKSFATWGNFKWDDGSRWGEHEDNTVIKHQEDSSLNPGPLISTTPHFERAKYYALSSKTEGFVFKINRNSLKEHGIQEFIVNNIASNPKIPLDEEVALYVPDGLYLPEDVIENIIDFFRN